VYGEELRSRPAWGEPNHTIVRARATVLEPERFMVALHGRNTSSSIRLGGERLPPTSAQTVLHSFGLGRARSLRSVLAAARGPADWAAREASLRAVLDPLYRRYLEGGTSEARSISLETAVFFGFLCEAVGARRILDLGSGFGSVVSARYAAAHPSVISHSVELSPERLARLRRDLQRLGLPTGELLTWPEFVGRREAGYDLVLHDLDGMLMRAQTLPGALDAVLPTGLLLLDDSHKQPYAAAVRSQLDRYCADVVPQAEELTRDRFGRCALLLARVIGPLDRGSPW
jgi:predicted O-methyltransferase YrrM